jgi:hypothetical protein
MKPRHDREAREVCDRLPEAGHRDDDTGERQHHLRPEDQHASWFWIISKARR